MARPPIVVQWDAEQDEHLRRLAAQGVSVVKAAGALNRKMSSVRIRARKLGLSFPKIREARKKWSPQKQNKNSAFP